MGEAVEQGFLPAYDNYMFMLTFITMLDKRKLRTSSSGER